ncbi:esterase [Cryptococcus wingfieldii CBS 7118]|uniref:Esterase n=1 Tax=Cryptococcus wingfieldii CBS 7118 TaxID=1295528 RepID=A0A1E3IIQ7_9TREE|nr:esterase [Cryptococcus wingfieldii CBS 7118]ODN88482.1 esterase [Cryptococcus wingfieldii CBS 7118]
MPRNNAPLQPLPLQHLLQTYTTSHPLRSPSPLPPSSRIDPKLEQRLPPPASSSPFLWSLAEWWLFIRFVFTKGIHVLMALLSHLLFGPKRTSWGYRMTLITSFMRNIADHSSLADIVLIRRFVSLHFLMPLPGDAVVTPITFVVPKRTEAQAARGFLRQCDLLELGDRELAGEWVVGTEVWKRLKAEKRARQRHRQGKGKGRSASPRAGQRFPELATELKNEAGAGERVIYYIHGGAYYVGNAATHRLITIGVSKSCNARVFAITYRLAPEHAFPLPLHDVLHGYLRLLSAPLSIPPENIIIAGDSAGGGLSLALCMYLRDEGYKLPAGLILMSPWVDLTMSCGSWDENASSDVVPRPEADDHLNPVGCYLGPKGISTYLTHPYASPLFGDFHGLPPMLIQSGDSEVLRDEIILVAHKATLAGVSVTHELYEDMVHVFQMFSFLPATEKAIYNVGKWVRTVLPGIEREKREAEGRVGESGVGGLHLDVIESVEEEIAEEGAHVIMNNGEEIGVNKPEDSSERARRTPKKSTLRYETQEAVDDEPTVDTDSLATSDSGSPTPTKNHKGSGYPFPRVPATPTRQDPIVPQAHTLPRLRRTQTSVPAFTLSPPPVPSTFSRRHRPTASTSSSTYYPSPSSSRNPSQPTSPSSGRKRLMSGTLSYQPQPSTRTRSKSHSDVFSLVEGYVEGGAANQTTVYAPGGEIRSVGVLGEDEDE